MSDVMEVNIRGETWTCRCCGRKFKGESAFEAHLKP
jgi:ribosomal protein L37AE/L43A